MLGHMNEVTRVLCAIDRGEPHAAAELLPLVYDELRKLANARLAKERAGQTLEATALVHEAYLRLVDPAGGPKWDTRGHFFAAAAEAMRRILVESARRKQTEKHGGGLARHDVADLQLTAPELAEELLALDEALDRLAAVDLAKAELVKLRHFAGLTIEQAAQALGISTATANRHWAYARAWLHQAITGGDSSGENPGVSDRADA
jgi:RNA polymerase sigma factor (TIGR02999 family)